MQQNKRKSTESILWDLFCISTIIGIWPRFIEPKIIKTTSLSIPIPNLPKALQDFKILQFSDLHLHSDVSDSFLDKIVSKCEALKPDLIVYTGDFLCYSECPEPKRLSRFLNRLHAPYGNFAVLGNHDYASCVSVNSDGDYDMMKPSGSSLKRAFSRLNSKIVLTKKTTEQARSIPLNPGLISLLKETQVCLLHNETKKISVQDAALNIVGFGEHTLGRVDKNAAYKGYDRDFPGLLLLHNPDGAPHLKDHPGNIILSGHTHGGQVNLPWMWKKFTLLENMEFKKGLVKTHDKWMYINRGIGSIMPFRWFSAPEILFLTLKEQI